MSMAYDDTNPVDDEYGPSKRDRLARLAKYRSQITACKKWRRDYETTWRDMIDLYANHPFKEGELDEYRDTLEIAIGFSVINVIFPSVSLQRPKVTVQATRPERTDQAAIAEGVVNYWWRRFEYQAEFRAAVKDYLVMGHGWVKTTWLRKEEEKELSVGEYRDEISTLLAQKYEAVEMDPANSSLYPEDNDIIATVPTVRKVVVQDHPQLERVSPFDVFVDPDATRLFDARWLAQRIAVPVAEAKQRKDWNSKVRGQLVGGHVTKQKQEDGYYDDQIDPEMKYVIIWEHYDLVNGKLCTFADEGDDFLKPPEDIPFPFGHPFVMLRNYEVPEKFYPIGELECLEPLNAELNIIRTSQMNDIKQYRRAYLTKKKWLDDKAVGALASPRDGEVIFADDEDAPDDLRQVLAPVPTMGINPDSYQMSETIQDDMTRVSAVSEYQQGAMPEIRRTATEAGIIQDASNARAADKLAQIEVIIAGLARRVIQLAQKFLSQQQVARIAGEGTEVKWVPFDAESIVGEFDFEVEAGSTQPRNETFRRQMAMQLMDAFASPLFQPQPDPNTGQLVPVLDARKVAILVMKDGFGIKDAESYIVPLPPPPVVDPETGVMVDPQTGMPVMGPEQQGVPTNGEPPEEGADVGEPTPANAPFPQQ